MSTVPSSRRAPKGLDVSPSTEAHSLDITAPGFAMRSEALRAARDASWYARTNYGIAVLRHEDVGALLRSDDLIQGSAKWPEHHGVHSGTFYEWWRRNLLVLEGDDHHRIRRLLNPAFSPKSARAFTAQFRDLANELIDAFAERGRCEFVGDFSEPFATRALCLMLGLPQGEWPTIARLASDVGYALGVTIQAEQPRIDAAVAELHEYAERLIAERAASPGDDLVSKLVGENAHGARLSDAELRNAIVLLIFGGMDTTRNQLGLGVQSFVRQPEQWELLAARPDELGRTAVEELMRVNPTTRWVTREARVDFEHRGLEIAAGTTVHLFTLASGTDPIAHPDPEIDLSAEHAPHYGFGGGVHHCLGQHVARADMIQAFTALATRLTNLAIVPGGDEWLPDSGNTGPVRLELTFDRR